MTRVLLLALLALAACRSPEPAPLPDVELYGERLLLPDARREFDPASRPVVRVLAASPPALTFELVAGERRVAAVVERTERRGEATLVWFGPVEPPLLGEGEIALRLDGRVRRRWPVSWQPAPDSLPALQEAVAHGRAGRHAEALRLLEERLPGLEPRARHHALAERARALQRLGRVDDAVAAWRRTAADARARGWLGEAARCLRVASFVAFVARDIAGAERLLDEADVIPDGAVDAWERARRTLHRGYHAEVLGDYARAAGLFRAAADRAYALGADSAHAAAVVALAVLTLHQGHHEAARELLDAVAPFFEGRRADRRAYVAYLENRAWVAMGGRAPEERPRDLATARALYGQARAIYRQLGEPQREAFSLGKLARIALLEGDLDAARRLGAEARALDRDGATVPQGWLHLLDGEVELAAARPEAAREAFGRTAETAREIGPDRDLLWRALHGLGRVEKALGRRAAARQAFAEALALLDDIGRRTALAESRGAFYAERRPLLDDMVALLVEDGALADAFAVADAAQARVVRALQTQARVARLQGPARQRHEERVGAWLRRRDAFERGRREGWHLPADALGAWKSRRAAEREGLQAEFEAIYRQLDAEVSAGAPEAGTAQAVRAALEPKSALVLYVRAGRGVHAFWLDAAGLEQRVVAEADLLGPWRARLSALSHLYVVPADVAAARELHRAVSVPVGYLPYAGLLTRPAPATLPAVPVVVADPVLDLPAARDEGEAVARRLPGARLLLGRAARREAVIEALRAAPVFHFAGHGELEPASPWDAHLRLADDARLTLADLLTTPVGARVVVLGACETARTAALGAERLGLADAFALAGAHTVVAADRVVDDAAVAAFVERFYAHGGARTPGPALRAAAAEVPEGAAFRLVGRP